ncbi:MAG: polyprenyl synthetase family protein [Halothiobacillaceae bacterium]|mgnify:FL=1|nr:polyprenyl synthetase family protein [Halothiobacillaceae bacterium]
METTEFQAYVHALRERTDAALRRVLPPADAVPVRLHAALSYAVLQGGKRIRPLLVHAAGHALGASPELLDGPACAVELIHAYSLVHDDLPAMDDDDLRRGQPTVHRAYDEATAILVGDALQTLAFAQLARAEAGERQSALLHALSEGAMDMVRGQALDLSLVGTQTDIATLQTLHALKTGALIRAAVRLGGLCAGSPEDPRLDALDSYARAIGLAFQIQDDILDETEDTATLGKRQGADRALDKPTFVSLLGLDRARERARQEVERALTALSGFDSAADPLRHIARYIVERNH